MCEEIRRTKACGNVPMNCENGICSSSNTPNMEYTWLHKFTDSVVNCVLQDQIVTADSADAILFGNKNCLASHAECKMSKSMIIWDMDVIHKCPY